MPESDGPGGENCTPDPSVPSRVRWLLRYARMYQKNGSRRGVEPPPLGYEPWWIPDLPAMMLVDCMGVAPITDSLPANLAALGTCQPIKSWWKRRDLHPPSGTANAARPYGTCVPMKCGGGPRSCTGFSRSSDARHHWIGLTSKKTGPRRRYRAVVCRLSAGCSAFELLEG